MDQAGACISCGIAIDRMPAIIDHKPYERAPIPRWVDANVPDCETAASTYGRNWSQTK